ncbi:MAG: type II secretion system protein [Minisyncoccia bacterium]
MNIRIQKGFTLLEVLLTIALMGILFAILLVAINPTRQLAQSRNLVRQSDINEIYEALEYYRISQKNYPVGITETKTDICDTGSNSINQGTIPTGCIDLRVLVPTYLSAIPKDPSGGLYKLYRNPENNKIGIEAPDSELGKSIAVNPTPTPEELIQAEIAAGTLVPTGTQQLKYERLVYTNNAGTQTYIDKATTTRTCPSGYIAVPGNSMYGTSEFCVMKYEAKTGSSTVPATTQAAGAPQAVITQPNAITACSLNGSGYGLISNAEWMTLARNIEAQLSNWTIGTAASTAIGTGALYRGHSDGFTDWGGAYALAAGPDNDGYKETGNSGFSFERRTHTLSNGEIIWDLSGNVSEWTNDTIMGVNKPTGGFEYPTINNYGNLNYDLISPSNNTWDSDQAMGRYFEGELTGGPFAFVRGGTWGNGAAAGIFALFMYNAPSAIADHIGFRCVLR